MTEGIHPLFQIEKSKAQEKQTSMNYIALQIKQAFLNDKEIPPKFKQIQSYIKECHNLDFSEEPPYFKLRNILE